MKVTYKKPVPSKLPDGTEVCGRSGCISKATLPNGDVMYDPSVWGAKDADGVKKNISACRLAKIKTMDGMTITSGIPERATAGGAAAWLCKTVLSMKYLRQSQSVFRKLFIAATNVGPMLHIGRGGGHVHRGYDIESAYFNSMQRPMPVPRTHKVISPKYSMRWIMNPNSDGFVRACVEVPKGVTVGPLPVVGLVTVERRLESRGRVGYVNVRIPVKLWPTGNVCGAWTLPLLRNAVHKYGCKIKKVHESVSVVTDNHFHEMLKAIESIPLKSARKALYTRLWGKHVIGAWRTGIVTDGKVAWSVNKPPIFSNAKQNIHRFFLPEKAAYGADDIVGKMVNTINDMPKGSVSLCHLDSIHVKDDMLSFGDIHTLKSRGFKLERTGNAWFSGIGTYKYYRAGRLMVSKNMTIRSDAPMPDGFCAGAPRKWKGGYSIPQHLIRHCMYQRRLSSNDVGKMSERHSFTPTKQCQRTGAFTGGWRRADVIDEYGNDI